MQVSVIASGSKANCTYIEAEDTAILVDCGLSCKEALRRIEALGLKPEKISAILLTHEHSDHIRGLSVLSRKLKVPIFANPATSEYLNNIYALETFTSGHDFEIEQFEIHPFSVVHDAADPVGFTLSSAGIKCSIVTDLGRVTSVVKHAIQDSNFLVLESNYDQDMLRNCEYPWQLKQRINSAHGHLSNDDAALFLSEQQNDSLRHVVLGHLSENSNKTDLALQTAAKFNNFERFDSIQCGSVHRSTEVLSL